MERESGGGPNDYTPLSPVHSSSDTSCLFNIVVDYSAKNTRAFPSTRHNTLRRSCTDCLWHKLSSGQNLIARVHNAENEMNDAYKNTTTNRQLMIRIKLGPTYKSFEVEQRCYLKLRTTIHRYRVFLTTEER